MFRNRKVGTCDSIASVILNVHKDLDVLKHLIDAAWDDGEDSITEEDVRRIAEIGTKVKSLESTRPTYSQRSKYLH